MKKSISGHQPLWGSNGASLYWWCNTMPHCWWMSYQLFRRMAGVYCPMGICVRASLGVERFLFQTIVVISWIILIPTVGAFSTRSAAYYEPKIKVAGNVWGARLIGQTGWEISHLTPRIIALLSWLSSREPLTLNQPLNLAQKSWSLTDKARNHVV